MEEEYIQQEVRQSLLVKDYEMAQSADTNQTVLYDYSILFYPETILVKQTQAVNITFFVMFLILVTVAVVANLSTIYVSYTRYLYTWSHVLHHVLTHVVSNLFNIHVPYTRFLYTCSHVIHQVLIYVVSCPKPGTCHVISCPTPGTYTRGLMSYNSSPNLGSNPNFAIISVPVYCETDASDQVTTEADIVDSIRREITELNIGGCSIVRGLFGKELIRRKDKSLVIYIHLLDMKNRLLYRVCLISLACSDLIVAVMSGINNIPKFLLPSHNFFILGEFMCSFMPLLQNTSLLANSMTLSCIAVDRYQMVVQAVRGRWDPGRYVCFGVVAGIWVISAGVASPMYGLYLWITAMIIQDDGVNITILEQYSVFHMCLLDDKTFKYTYFLIVFSFIFLPLLCTFLVLYILVVRYLFLWRRPGSCLSVQNIPGVGETDRKKTLFTFQRPGHKTVVPPTFIVKEVTKKDDGDPPRTFNVDLTDQRTNGNKYSVSRPDGGSTNRTRKSAAQVPANNGRTTHAARKLRTFKIIMALMITFICLRMPSWIFTIYLLNPKSSTGGNFWWNVQNVFSLLVVLNCSVNPFLYCFLNQVLRIYGIFRGWLTRFLGRCRFCRGEKDAREVAVNGAEEDDELAVEGPPQMLMVPRGPYSHQDQEDQPQTGQDKSGSPQGTCSTGVNSNNTSPSLKNRGQQIDPDRCIVQKPFYVYS
uniref:G-protein coupled receptors family 1 profile domain-containing protein n=1 Tax=Timema shepardi TaxID=629360 RepID=A0A7R9B375_TIMSH|nr:unnamed protein product [Timema shepardi]